MDLQLLRTLSDFGLVVLIWMVQLIIYPSFKRYTKNDFIPWHRIYVRRIAYIVIPLMLAQSAISVWQVYSTPSIYSVCSLILILVLWVFTFTHFAPAHQRISKGTFESKTLTDLVKRNWVRTFLWSIIFIWGLLKLWL